MEGAVVIGVAANNTSEYFDSYVPENIESFQLGSNLTNTTRRNTNTTTKDFARHFRSTGCLFILRLEKKELLLVLHIYAPKAYDLCYKGILFRVFVMRHRGTHRRIGKAALGLLIFIFTFVVINFDYSVANFTPLVAYKPTSVQPKAWDGPFSCTNKDGVIRILWVLGTEAAWTEKIIKTSVHLAEGKFHSLRHLILEDLEEKV